MIVTISDVRFAPARRDVRVNGLRGWVCCRVDEKFRLDGLAVRRAADGRFILSFPVRTDASGRQHAIYSPLSREVHDSIEIQVIATLRERGWLS